MKKNILYSILVMFIGITLTGCMAKNADEILDPSNSSGWSDKTAPRLIVKGTVTNEAGEPLKNIRVDLYGVREETEQDILTYNYSYTNAAGEYVITRYRGRQSPNSITLVFSDPSNTYQEQTKICDKSVEVLSSSGDSEWRVTATLTH